MALDSSIPLQSNAPDPMTSLSSMLDVGAKSLSLQKNRATFDADVAKNKAESSTSQSAAQVNAATVKSSIAERQAQSSSAQSQATVNAANVNPLIQQQAAQTSMAQTGANSAGFGFEQKKTQAAQQGMMELIQNKNINDTDPATYSHEEAIHTVAAVRDYMIANGQDKAKVESISARLISVADKPGAMADIMKQIIRGGLTPSENASAQNPDNQYVDDGEAKTPVSRNAMSPQFNPAASKARIVNKPGPTTEYVDNTGTKRITGAADSKPGDLNGPTVGMPTNERDAAIGRATSDIAALRREAAIPGKNAEQLQILNSEHAKAQAALQQAQAMPTKPAGDPRFPNSIATSLPAGQGESIAATQKGVNDHYKSLQDGAASAAQDIGILQNIISHAKGASTGIGSDKSAIAQAIFGKLGITSAQQSTLDYDMLGKNAAMIQLAGGDTNLAKTLAGAANPSSHMSEEAIRQAAHQIIGQKKMALEGLKMFTPLKALSDGGHMEAYNAMLPKFMAASDPRILQLSNMSDAEKKKMKSSMSPEESKAFGNKIRVLESFGIKP